RRFFLEHQPPGTEAHGLPMEFGVADAGQDEYMCPRGSGEQRGYAVDGALPSEVEIEQDNVGLRATDGLQDLSARRSLANHGQPWLALEEQAQPRAHDGVVFNDKHTNVLRGGVDILHLQLLQGSFARHNDATARHTCSLRGLPRILRSSAQDREQGKIQAKSVPET